MVAVQRNISVATEADKRSARPMDKSCVTSTFCSQLVSWDTQYYYETSELVVQTLLINFKHGNNFKNYITRFFLGECDEKLTVIDGKKDKIL